MSRSAIRTVVESAVATALEGTGYRADDNAVKKAVDQVCVDLDTLADAAVDGLRQAATGLGARPEQIDRIFEQVGLGHDPEPVAPEAPAQAGGVTLESVAAAVDAVQQRLDTALAAAARQGFRL